MDRKQLQEYSNHTDRRFKPSYGPRPSVRGYASRMRETNLRSTFPSFATEDTNDQDMNQPIANGAEEERIPDRGRFRGRIEQAAKPLLQHFRTVMIMFDKFELRVLRHLPRRVAKFLYSIRPKRRKHPVLARLGWGFMALLVLSTIIIDSVSMFQHEAVYALSPETERLLSAPDQRFADKLELSKDGTSYEYNAGYSGTGEGLSITGGGPRFTASYNTTEKMTATVKDPVNGVSFGIRPLYAVSTPRKDANRLIFPLKGMDGQKVETMQVASAKEDIILNKFQGDKKQFRYELELAPGTEARLEDDGSIGVYGASAELLGDVKTGSEKDAELLKKARANAKKTTLLFRLPAPFIKDSSRQQTKARAWYGLEGTELTIYTENLKSATYPLTIDPTIYIDSATRLMAGNNESNIDFDIQNELIQKGKTTGGRFDSWSTSSTSLSSNRWRHAVAVYGGNIYVVGGNTSSGVDGKVYWARINTSTGDIESPNPGEGACSNWCTNVAYDMPASRRDGALVAYNGYLYYLGGNNGTTSQSTIYIAKLGSNGEPQLWRPTTSDPLGYWYTSSMTLPSAMSFLGVAAYNNRLYITGGINAVQPSATGTLNVYMADMLPTGKIRGSNATTWYSLTSLAAGNERHSVGVQVYNDYMYIVGGAKATTTQNTVFVGKISTVDGTIASWQSTTPVATSTGAARPRSSQGGKFTTVWGGFMYVMSGCSTLNASGYCTAAANDVQIASINADGTLTDWTSMTLTSGSANTNIGYGLAAWRNRLYSIGGCSAQNTTTGACTTLLTNDLYASINPDGDVSTVSTSVASGTAPCAASTWYDCNLPPQGDGNGQSGQMAGAVVINNGYIYYMGGCTAVGNGSICFTGNSGKAGDNISYAAIDSQGNITRISGTCSGTTVGSWCVRNPGLPVSLAGFSYAVFNNTLYVIGGTTGTQWQADVHRTTFNNDGTWGSWTTQTFAAVGLGNAKGYQFAFTRANPASASTYPGNLYVLGGCSGVTATDSGLNCSGTLYTEVYKCFIKTDTSIETTGSPCTTTGQLQIDSEPGTGGNQGLGVMAGAVYANYIYLIGGQSVNQSERGSIMYAKIDNSNNIVAVSGGIWTTSANSISPVRRRGMAFGYNGYLYALAGYNSSGSGSLNDLLYAKINVSDGSIGSFATSTVTVSARWDLRGAVNNGYVYAIGGCQTGVPPADCTVMTDTVQTFQLYNNYSGSPKTFNTETNQFTVNRLGASAAVTGGYIYLAGGCTGTTDCATPTSAVLAAQINENGTIGTWSTLGQSLPAARAWGALHASGGYLYYVGGLDSTGTAVATTYYATASGGTTGAWANNSGGNLPAARSRFGSTIWNGRMYVVGGNDSGGVAATTVYVSQSVKSGGVLNTAWASTTALSEARSGPSVTSYANNLYVFGGYTGSSYLNDSQYAQISGSDGTIGSWTRTTSLPRTFRNASAFAANGFMYVFAGRTNDTTCDAHMYVAPISANTTIASGNNPTGVGEWYETNVRYNGPRYGAASVFNQGKAYMLGGACGSTLTYAANVSGSNYNVMSATLQAQPQIAKYSRMIDTDKDVFPTVWLMNGLDNSTGARWYMRYRTMTDPLAPPWSGTGNDGTNCSQQQMSSWGQETNFGEITLGKVETYNSLDGSGSVTNGGGSGGGCARYFYMNVTIDSQQAYGYPEDVTRGPTIADLSLYFTSSPGQRLIHGKTFNAGEQQPLDTPCRQSNNGSDPLYASCPLP